MCRLRDAMRSTGVLLIVLQIVHGELLDTTTLSPFDSTQSDPCSSSHEIASADRVVSSDLTTGRCDDNLNTGWYKFTVNNVAATLPTVCIRPGACGGDVSLRIDLGDQSLPGVGEEVQAWSCGAYDVLGKFDCCVLRQPARIRNCSSFLAYQLQKPDRCDVAYCVEHPEEKIPSNVLVKYGEDVSPQSTTSSSSTMTTQDFHNRKWCNEGMVWCTRGAPRCMSYEECLAIPHTTISTSDITTTTSQETTTPAATTETTSSSDVTITEAEETTTLQTTALRYLFRFTVTPSSNDDSVSTEVSTSRGHPSTVSLTTTGDYSTTGSTGTMPGHPDGVPGTDAISTEGTSTAKTTEAAFVQTTGSYSPSSSITTAVDAGGHVERSTNKDTTSSISTTSATSSPTTMTSTSASSSPTTSETLPPVHSTEDSSSRSPGSTTVSIDVTTEAGSTKSTSSSPRGSVDGRIVLAYPTDTFINYTASVKTCMSNLLNIYDEKGRSFTHTFTTDDVNVMTVDTSSTTTTIVMKVVYDKSAGRVVMDAEHLIHMMKYLQEKNKLNSQDCRRNLGAIQDFYRYGEQPTEPPMKSGSGYSLFYDKLPLFIAIIVMVTVCFLILIFGIVYLRCFHHQRTWDRTKDVERAKLKEAKEHKGLENPVPDSEMMKDEAVVRETSLTVNGSHPQHPTPLDDDKGWVIPIDQAPESQGQVALKSEDTQL
ncbi:uncharacterized protein [Haliotis asinina]|uniref:uncharacterized protein isoform X4 n=1 Tax=Haliotis asinina TaxID=109174 RepID=UPI00353218F7